MHHSDPGYDLSRWWCATWQKVQPDAVPPVYRYYQLCLQQVILNKKVSSPTIKFHPGVSPELRGAGPA